MNGVWTRVVDALLEAVECRLHDPGRVGQQFVNDRLAACGAALEDVPELRREAVGLLELASLRRASSGSEQRADKPDQEKDREDYRHALDYQASR